MSIMDESLHAEASAEKGDNSQWRPRFQDRLVSMMISGMWLIFLYYPFVASLKLDSPLRELGLANTIAFAVAYLYGMAHATAVYPKGHAPPYRRNLVTFLVALALVGTLVIIFPFAVTAGSLLIYITALAIYTLPARLGIALGLLGAGSVGLLALPSGDFLGFMLFGIALAVYIAGVLEIQLDRRKEQEARNARSAAILDERERVARDVHDVLGHSLTVIAMKSELAGKLVERNPTRAQEEIAEITRLSREAISEVRATVASLRFSDLADELAAARVASKGAGLTLKVSGTADDADPGHRILFGWVLREAVTNIVRHARATRVWVEIESAAITVRDNGRGFAVTQTRGNGLRGLRERVEKAGGELIITSGDSGTTLRAQIGKSKSD
ncbi:MAG: sensor histidine kinase [Actinomycetaceae bacterium]|nr:sensor histidine kinase [Actinomycetaceae bacterium]